MKHIPKTIGVERTTSKWIGRARVAGPDYAAGIAAPKKPWAASAAGAANSFFSAVSSPEVKSLFVRGIRRAGDERWSRMATEKGVGRFAPGVELSEPYFRSQMTDVITQIEAVVLKPRGPRGSAQNYDLVKQVGDKLHAWRLAKAAST